MKVLCVTPWFPSHPEDRVGNFIFNSVEALVALGHELHVLVTFPWKPKLTSYFHPDFVSQKIDIKKFSNTFTLQTCHYFSLPRNCLRSFSNWIYIRQVTPILEKLVLEYKCDIIHAHTELSALVAVNVGQRLGIPVVTTIHGLNPTPKYWRALKKFSYLFALSERIIVVGAELKPIFEELIGKKSDRFRVVYNGFRVLGELNPQKSLWPKELRIISVSNLHEGKGIDITLQALAKLSEQGIKNWAYIIIGRGRERKNLERMVSNLGLKQKVSFIGECTHDQVYQYLQGADIFLLPSYREAFGIVYLEAMSVGLLAIGVYGQGPSAFIEHEKTGLLVFPQNVNSVVKTLKKIFIERDQMQEIAKAGREHVLRHFTWSHHAKNLTKVYQEVVKQSHET